MSEVKALSGVEIKNADLGQATVRFATYDEIDHHGDITRKGAFDKKQVVVSAYNHASWGGMLPVGKAVIRDGEKGVYGDIQFFMNTSAGRETFETVKELGHLQQWSYGFDIEQKSHMAVEDEEGGERPVRVLEKVNVHEISPVLMGAGKSTATVAVKTLDDIYDLFEEKMARKKPKPKDEDEEEEDDKKKPSSSKKPSEEEDEEEYEDDDDKKKPARRKKPSGSGKMRMSDQTEDVVTSLRDLADRAEEIVTLRKSQGKSDVSDALAGQFTELLKQADRIFELLPKDEDGYLIDPTSPDESLMARTLKNLSEEL